MSRGRQKSLRRPWPLRFGRAVGIAGVACMLAADAVAGDFLLGGGWLVAPAPYGWALPPPSILPDSFGPCLTPMNCPDYEQFRRFLDRYERNYGQRFAVDRPAVVVPVQPRDVPPTPQANIQPQYRGASQIRPEFEQTGKWMTPRE